MQKIAELMQAKAIELLESGKAEKVLAWRAGEFFYDNAPAAFSNVDACKEIVYNEFCPANLAKYLIEATKQQKKTAVFLKPCDTYGVNQLLKDNRIKREYFYAVGTPCSGMLDEKKMKALGAKAILAVTCEGDKIIVETAYGTKEFAKEDVLLDKCIMCKGNKYKIADEELGEKLETPKFTGDKFAAVKAIEAMPEEERFAFWQAELSKCIRCNACRDICPACSCEQCIFDNQDAPVAGKAAADDVEEQLFHLIRAYHVAGRCVGCGECARVCPQGVKLGLLNLKFIKDINEFYGAYQAGADATTPSPLVSYKDNDPEAEEALQRRG
ncbi:MAG: 4Fe-4S dicluster domain-containing protein [Phascolarctobacterium sp.]|nr:4Fe-4S dicluster domain-containing protein [Phascolarctobacterium sp.]